jgi:DNA-binding transcriptional MerR regulator
MLIGELATATGVSTKTLRFYEADGLLFEPDRTSAGYRDCADTAIDRVVFIRQAQAAGLTLAQIRQILTIRDGGQPPVTMSPTLSTNASDSSTGDSPNLNTPAPNCSPCAGGSTRSTQPTAATTSASPSPNPPPLSTPEPIPEKRAVHNAHHQPTRPEPSRCDDAQT